VQRAAERYSCKSTATRSQWSVDLTSPACMRKLWRLAGSKHVISSLHGFTPVSRRRLIRYDGYFVRLNYCSHAVVSGRVINGCPSVVSQQLIRERSIRGARNLKLGGNVGQGQKHKRAIFSVCGPNGDLVHQNT